MGINWDNPNLDAIDAMGFLKEYEGTHGEDPGWARSVIERIRAEQLADTPKHKEDTGGDWDRGNYDADELAMYDWYTETYIGMNNKDWDALVDKHQDKAMDNVHTTPPGEYDDFTDEGIWKPPTTTEFTGDTSGNNEMVVNTEAIQHLINQFATVAEGEHKGLLLDLATELDGKMIKPGGFARAEILRQKIDGTGEGNPGVRGDTIGLLRTLHRALFDLQAGLKVMKTEYEKTEEDNEVTQAKLQELLKDAWSEIGALNKYGTVGGSTEA